MINREHDLPITKQALVLRISRGSVYYLARPMPEADLAIMRRLDRLVGPAVTTIEFATRNPAPTGCGSLLRSGAGM
jgi:hypothetical protein